MTSLRSSAAPRSPRRRAFWREATALREHRALLRDPVYALEGVANGGGRPVMLIPGFLCSDNAMSTMAGWLRRAGYRPLHSGMRVNAGCAERDFARVERRAEQLVEREGRRLAVVGHSRGGHFTRVLAVRRPDLVSGIVTLAAPPLNPDAIHRLVAIPTVGLTLLGSLGAPGLMRLSCFIGSCCERFRDDLHAAIPAGLPFTALFSRLDGIVDWHLLFEREARTVAVDATHLGIVVNPDAYRELAVALEALED
jgi:triacylglycerol lipase